MRIIKCSFIALCLLAGAVNPAAARVNIDLNLSLFPELVPVPGYPVYYAPALESNYFFYDGMYWLFEDDDWYVSEWYNGPWEYVDREYVPIYVLRIPVRYYRRPPPYFRGWYYDAPPRWNVRWGEGWERHHHGWDQWDRRHVPPRAPLPSYQRPYSGERYPDRGEQRNIRERDYHYQPRDNHVRERDADIRQRDNNERQRDHDVQRDNDERQHDRDIRQRIPVPTQPDRRDNFQPPRSHQDDRQQQRPHTEERQPPQQRDDRESYRPPRNQDREQHFNNDRAPQNPHEQREVRPPRDEVREHPQPRAEGHGQGRDDGDRNDHDDKGQGRR